MKLLLTLKTFLKTIKNTIFIQISYFLILPLAMSLFFGNLMHSESTNPINVEPVPIYIDDKDNSTYSKDLSNFIENDNNGFFYISDNEKYADFKILIPNNYSQSIIKNKPTNIDIIEVKPASNVSEVLKNTLDKYHENLALDNIPLDNTIVNQLKKSTVKTSFIDSSISQTTSEYYAVSILGFMLLTFMTNNVTGNYLGESNGIQKRMYSMPIKRTTQLIYDFIVSLLYISLFVFAYILIYRFLNLAFTENLLPLFILCIIASSFTACVSIFIYSFFKKNIGTILMSLFMFIQMIFGGTFMPISGNLSMIGKLSPFYLTNELFMKFTINDSLYSVKDSIFIVVLVSLILFMISFFKEKYSWREF